MNVKSKNIPFTLIVALMLLASMNFMSKFFYFTFASIFLLFLFKVNIKFDYTSIIYLVAGFIMAMYHMSEGVLAALRCFAGVICYWVGYNVASGTTLDEGISLEGRDFKKDGLEFAYIVLVAVASGSFIHYILNFFINIGSDLGRNTIDLWTGEIMASTGQAALSCIMAGYAMSKILSPRRKFSRALGILIVLGILAYNLVLAGRTLIVMMCIVFIVGMIYIIQNEKNASRKNKTLMFVVLALVIVSLIVLSNIGGIWDYIQNSNLYRRFFSVNSIEIDETNRWEAKTYYLKHMFEHPFGGFYLQKGYGGHAHDLILDAYDEFGFIVAACLIAIVFLGVKEVWEFIRKNEIPTAYKCSFLCVHVAILIEFCVEPIFAGMPWLFACYALMNGMVAKLNREYS